MGRRRGDKGLLTASQAGQRACQISSWPVLLVVNDFQAGCPKRPTEVSTSPASWDGEVEGSGRRVAWEKWDVRQELWGFSEDFRQDWIQDLAQPSSCWVTLCIFLVCSGRPSFFFFYTHTTTTTTTLKVTKAVDRTLSDQQQH